MIWEVVGTNRVRLTAETRRNMEAMLLVVRAECIRSWTMLSEREAIGHQAQVAGIAEHWRSVADAIDYLLHRIGGGWDIDRLQHSMYLASIATSGDINMSITVQDLNRAIAQYESHITSASRYRESCQGHDRMAGEAGAIPGIPIDRDRSSNTPNQGDESDRSG